MGLHLAFWLFAITTVGAALAVVIINDLFRAALCLILCFFMTAGLFVTLNADLLAGLQVLVYVGAISMLIMFAIVMTRDMEQGNRFNKMVVPVGLVAVVLAIAMIIAVVDADNFASLDTTEELSNIPSDALISEDKPTTSAIGQLLFSEDNGYLLVFEVAGVLLMAAAIGALVLSRER
ncbi:MAG: NADH-quinone oxidoreductase subunit J [Chloroflexota bacterium]|nr:NADH-quinone oxidoreductase subunit J [Chloroflexota bacterium]